MHTGTPLWCRSQAERRGARGVHLPPPPIGDCRLRLWVASPGPGRARSLSLSLPASLHTRAAALSQGNPLRSKTPACGEAARWWPLGSSGRPHRNLTRTGEMGTGDVWVAVDDGMQLNAAPAIGPLWERKGACSWGCYRGHTTPVRNSSSMCAATPRCHPLRTPGMESSTEICPGRRPLATSSHPGQSNPLAMSCSRQ